MPRTASHLLPSAGKFRVFDDMVQALSSLLQTLVCCVTKACIYVVQTIHEDIA